MKHGWMGLLLMVALFSGCRKEEDVIGTPQCIYDKIREIQNQSGANSPREVWRMEIDAETNYYLFVMDCCDQFNPVYDSNCNYVCAPSGGFSGQGDGNCPVWPENIERVLIWTK
jgi:hypothetical protein